MPPPSTACSSPADLAPPGHWCNGTQLVRSSEPPQTLVRRGLSGAGDADGADDSLFPSAAIHGHGSRRLEAGGCCCHVEEADGQGKCANQVTPPTLASVPALPAPSGKLFDHLLSGEQVGGFVVVIEG